MPTMEAARMTGCDRPTELPASPGFEALDTLAPAGSLGASPQDPAAKGRAGAHFTTDSLETINAIFTRMQQGGIDGRVATQL